LQNGPARTITRPEVVSSKLCRLGDAHVGNRESAAVICPGANQFDQFAPIHLGASGQSVNRALHALEKSGLIQHCFHRYAFLGGHVLNVDGGKTAN
jgi:hypothetical protein